MDIPQQQNCGPPSSTKEQGSYSTVIEIEVMLKMCFFLDNLCRNQTSTIQEAGNELGGFWSFLCDNVSDICINHVYPYEYIEQSSDVPVFPRFGLGCCSFVWTEGTVHNDRELSSSGKRAHGTCHCHHFAYIPFQYRDYCTLKHVCAML